MIIKNTNILSAQSLYEYDAICFTSNSIVKKNNELVMGAGVAKAFKNKWPNLPKFFGTLVKLHGSRVEYFEQQLSYTDNIFIFSFPTKHHWKDLSDINLIKRSSVELVNIVDKLQLENVALPCPGIGFGGLNKDLVISVIEQIFDNRFIITFLQKDRK